MAKFAAKIQSRPETIQTRHAIASISTTNKGNLVPIPVPVHIYTLSRLVHAAAGSWEKQLRAIEEGKDRAFEYYLPLREAVVAYCKYGSKKYSEILKVLETRAASIPAPRGNDPLKNNKAAFATFVEDFHPRIQKFKKPLFHREMPGCIFAGVKLMGAPHFLATDFNGNDRHVFLLPSSWKDDDLKAYLELLAVIVEDTFQASPDSIWCMDLRNGHDVKFKGSIRMRGRCERAAQLYARLIRSMPPSI